MSLLQRFGATALLMLSLLVPAQAAFAGSLDDLSPGPDTVSIDDFIDEHSSDISDEVSSVAPRRAEDGPSINDKSPNSTFELPNSDSGDVGSFLEGYRPVTQEGLQEANAFMSPLTNFLGVVISGLIILTTIFLFLISGLDLMYILVPFTRKFLYEPGSNGAGQQMQGVGFGGTAVGANGGGNFVQRALSMQFVSDEAIKAVSLFGGSAPAQGQGMVNPMGGPMLTAQQNQTQSKGTVLGKYMKLRVFTMILFGMCVVLLFSSIFMDWGMNVGGMLISLIAEHWPW